MPQIDPTSETQMLSHELLQQNGSLEQIEVTQLWHPDTSVPPVEQISWLHNAFPYALFTA